jgi:hypothetical protein
MLRQQRPGSIGPSAANGRLYIHEREDAFIIVCKETDPNGDPQSFDLARAGTAA